MKNDPKLIQAFLKEKQQQHLYRKARISQSPQQPHMTINGEKFLTFCSNDYLGLANHPEILSAFKQAADQYGVGSGAAHLINGHSIEHQFLEEELAEFTGRDRALLFSTGYMANLGVVNALMERGDMIFADRLNHASLIDAGLLSNAKMKRYAHNDINALEKRYTKNTSDNTMILTDGVFSMDGDIAPVKQLSQIAKQHNAWLMVDDAHGFGTLGKTGAGLLEQENISQDDAPILMATLGKGIGTAGAFVAGSNELIEYLIQTARTYTFTTAMPPAIAAATRASLKIVQSDNERREKLNHHIKKFKIGADELGIKLMPSDTAIQPIMVGSTEQAVKISEQLRDNGILVTAIRPPTVPEGTSRLRVTFSAEHTDEDIVILLEALKSAFPDLAPS
jgi:8-amino-7-oxononanoate synthase